MFTKVCHETPPLREEAPLQVYLVADAVSFAVITERGIGQAIILDWHFVAAGLEALGVEADHGV